MYKIIAFCVAISLSLGAATTDLQRLAGYRKLEAYEVRPGILMLPKLTVDDEFCEIGLERLHYYPDRTRLYSDLSRKEIDQILDELVPLDQRGQALAGPPRPLITVDGHVSSTVIDFENVTVEISGPLVSSTGKSYKAGDVVATVRWKKRVCR